VLALALPFETVFAGLQDEMPIRYWKRTPRDFTREWEQAAREGRLDLDASSERAFLESVLDKLGISPAFEHLPDPFKKVFFGKLAAILDGDSPDYSYIPAPERTAIREILSTTLPDFPLNDS